MNVFEAVKQSVTTRQAASYYTGIANGSIQGWTAYKSPKRYKKYGSQKGWERVNQPPADKDGFREITEEEARQMELPF